MIPALSFAECFYLVVLTGVLHLSVRAFVNVAIVADMPKPPPRKTLHWVHFGLSEPAPWDDSIFGRSVDEIYGGKWAGDTTGIWPMVMELKDEPYEPEPLAEVAEVVEPKARDRFATKPSRTKVAVSAMGAPAQLVEVTS